MKTELENEEIHRYLRVYNYYKTLILSGQLPADTKLPSIRKGAMQLQMSRTTMETAYMLLAAEGYIISRPQSGYYVTDIAQKQKKQETLQIRKKEEKHEIRFDFASSNVDKESFRFDLWRRYMKSALRQDERLLSYGEPQGEPEFRQVLARYLRENRNVICAPEQIVIGAGVQSLLHILCPLLGEKKTAAFYNPQFLHGRAVFEDYGFEIADDYRGKDIGVYYISPSQMTKLGQVMPVADRLELIKEAGERDFLIIEDDYNSEFKYFQKPVPSMQGLAGGKGVVYLGTFSKMLLPSIRMSFMILPPELLERYEKRKHHYNQTASKAEQIALTQFIRDGHLASQIRKSRKIHLTKAAELAGAVQKVFGEMVNVETGEDGFNILAELETPFTAEEVAGRAWEKGVAVVPLGGENVEGDRQENEPGNKPDNRRAGIMLNCANVAVEDYEEALKELKQVVDSMGNIE